MQSTPTYHRDQRIFHFSVDVGISALQGSLSAACAVDFGISALLGSLSAACERQQQLSL